MDNGTQCSHCKHLFLRLEKPAVRVKTLQKMTATLTKAFTFVPYTKYLHEWKSSKASYYHHILYSYFKANPDAKAGHAYDALTTQIRSHIDNVTNTADIKTLWKKGRFDNICSENWTRYKEWQHS